MIEPLKWIYKFYGILVPIACIVSKNKATIEQALQLQSKQQVVRNGDLSVFFLYLSMD